MKRNLEIGNRRPSEVCRLLADDYGELVASLHAAARPMLAQPAAVTTFPQAFRTFYDSDGQLRWRLLALNGRTLAVSARGYRDIGAAWLGLTAAAEIVQKLTPSYHHPDSRVGWMWTASDQHGNNVANGARPYERRATCVVGFERFLLTLQAVADQL